MPKSGYRSEKGPVFSLAWFHTRLLVSLAISQSLCLSVYNFSQKRLVRFCWFFSIMLEVSNRQKLTKPDFFRKILFGHVLSKRGQKLSLEGIYLIFWQKLSFDFSGNSQEWKKILLFVLELKHAIWQNSCTWVTAQNTLVQSYWMILLSAIS